MHAEQKKLLRKILDGNCSEQELQEIKILLNKPEAKAFLSELMENQAAQVELDYTESMEALDKKTEEWLRKVHQQMDNETTTPIVHRVLLKKSSLLRYAAIWAGVLMVISVAFWQVYETNDIRQQVAYVEKANAVGIPVKDMLPDSSYVFLGAGSKLSYPPDFYGHAREIKLEGEAFFQIRHMPSKPFIVYTGAIQTQVLGTSFKVQAFDGKPLVVSVATGKVSVTKLGNSRKTLAMLTPGLKITYDAEIDAAVTGKVDIHGLLNWKDGDIVFDEQRLESVTAELERRFGVKIVFADESLKDYRVNGSFSAGQSVEIDMKILSRIGKFKYQSNNSKSFLIDKPDNMN